MKGSDYEYNTISSAVLIRIWLHWLEPKNEFSPFDNEKRGRIECWWNEWIRWALKRRLLRWDKEFFEALRRFTQRTELQNEQEDEEENKEEIRRINEWINELMNEIMNKLKNEWMNELMNKWMNEWMNKWICKKMKEESKTFERINWSDENSTESQIFQSSKWIEENWTKLDIKDDWWLIKPVKGTISPAFNVNELTDELKTPLENQFTH